MRRDRRVPGLAWGLGYLVVGAAIATALAWPIYQSERMLAVAAVGTAVGSGIILIARRLRLAAWLTGIIAVLVYLLAVVPLAIPSAMTSPARMARGVGEGVTGVVVGWKQLLTLSLPLGEYQAVLVPLLVVMMGGALLATAFITAGGRRAAAAVPMVMAMSVFGLVFGSSQASASAVLGPVTVPAPREVALTVALVVVSMLWLVGRARLARRTALRLAQAKTDGVRQRSESFWLAARRQTLAVILVVVAVVGGVAVAPIAESWAPRQALRDAVDPFVLLQQQPSPLSGYRAWFTDELYDTELFRVEGEVDKFDRVRIATLGYFDGEVFRAGNRSGDELFTRLPGSAATGGETLSFTISEGFAGVWMPIVGSVDAAPLFSGSRAEALGDGFYLSRNSSAAVNVASRTDGSAGLMPGDRYQLTARPQAETATLGSARGGEALVSAEDYPELAEWVEVQQVPRTGTGLTQLVTSLRERGYLSHSLNDDDDSRWVAALQASSDYVFQSSYAGHSAGRVEAVFSSLSEQQRIAGPEASEELLVSAVGDDEQFAAAGVLLARYLGFDSRVVVGTRLAADDELGAVPCAAGVCTGANMTSWIEVHVPGGDWVALDTSPQYSVVPIDVAEGEQLPENPTVPQESTTEVLDPPPAQRDDSEAAALDDPTDAGWLAEWLPTLAAVGTGTLIAALLLLPALFLLVLKQVRRRRRRTAPVPEVSAVGAWEELLDSYADYRYDVPSTATRTGIAQAIGRPAAATLAVTADLAVFAEHPPTRQFSDAAWALLDAERRNLAGEASFVTRLMASVGLRSLLRHFAPRAAVAAGLSVFKPKETVR